MNYHSSMDKFSILIGLPFLHGKKYFRESIESPRVVETLDDIDVVIPGIDGEKEYEYRAETPRGLLKSKFKVKRYLGKGYPTIIYNHGNAERPYDGSFNNIFSRDDLYANLVVVQEPFQDTLSEYMDKLKDLSNFVYMLSTTLKANEALLQHFKDDSSVMISGISLGGWVTNMHHAYYDTADEYVPMLAGAKLGHLFTESYYSKLTYDFSLSDKTKLEEILNFEEDFLKAGSKEVHPLLARYDQYIEYDVQKTCYRNTSINVIDKGHITGSRAYDQLIEHIYNVIK